MSMFRYHRSDPIHRYFRRYRAETSRDRMPSPPPEEIWQSVLASLEQANEVEGTRIPTAREYRPLSPALRCMITRFFTQ